MRRRAATRTESDSALSDLETSISRITRQGTAARLARTPKQFYV
jgi:hypothetical protein